MSVRFAALLTLAAVFGAPEARAQSCTDHAVFQQGTVLSVAHFNRKGKELGVQTSTIESTAPIDGGMRARIRTSSTLKGAPDDDVTIDFTCKGETITVDMRSFVPPEQVQAYEGWEVQVDSEDLAYPSALSAGQKLPDGKITMRMTMPGAEAGQVGVPSGVTFDVQVTNRKVEGKESVTTRAGTFDAWKITYDTSFEMKGALPMAIRSQGTHVEWYAPELGTTVKSESSRKGKLQSSTELKKLERG